MSETNDQRIYDRCIIRVGQLEAENAKLRELVKDIYTDMWALGEWLEPYEQRMRELGIEIPKEYE